MVKALPVGCIAGAASRPHDPEGAAVCRSLHTTPQGSGTQAGGCSLEKQGLPGSLQVASSLSHLEADPWESGTAEP